MSSQIEVNGVWKRPRFNYRGAANQQHWTSEECRTQMTESIRNLLESVASEIKEMNFLLRRIDRRLAMGCGLPRGRKKGKECA